MGKASILHYTWGPVVHNKSGAVVWEVRAARRPRICASQLTPALHVRSSTSARTAAGSTRRARASWSASRSRQSGRKGCICRFGAICAPWYYRRLTRRCADVLRERRTCHVGGPGAHAPARAHVQRGRGLAPRAAKGPSRPQRTAHAMPDASCSCRCRGIQTARLRRLRRFRRRSRSASQTRCSAP